MPRRRRHPSLARRLWPAHRGARLLRVVGALPLLYVLAALAGGLWTVNADWREPDRGVEIFLADNGIHVDIVVPARAAGVAWDDWLPPGSFRAVPADHRWLAVGAGDAGIYLNTPRWRDLTIANAVGALAGGRQVMHVQWIREPRWSARAIRLDPATYRRLAAAMRASFERAPGGRPVRLAHPGYGDTDAFYAATGTTSAIHTCNQWVASRLRLAGIAAPLWSPLPTALTARYRPAA